MPAAGLVALLDPETGERVVADTSRPEVRRALRAPGFAAAQAVFKKTRVDALALSTGESYERPLRASSRRGSAGADARTSPHCCSRPRRLWPLRLRPPGRRARRDCGGHTGLAGQRDRNGEQGRGHGRRDVHDRAEGDRAGRGRVHVRRRGHRRAARAAEPDGGPRRARSRARDAPLPGDRLRARRAADPADTRTLSAARRDGRRGRIRAAVAEGRLAAAEGGGGAEARRHPRPRERRDRPGLLGGARDRPGARRRRS